ncbi:transglycosylase family protein [Streptomyces sp. ODS28]|uniref:LysM peptidoglycan-binding domain-containing protein n=1 Tax=Streptomyces sp. ODS28 TaxID=3136688 RepID=UPI0031E7E3DD
MSIRRVTAALAGAGIAAPLALLAATAPAAQAAPNDGVWDRIAQCESGGNWSTNTGNGYHGGLQFSASTWRAYGGGAYAPTAAGASKSQQIEIAGKVQRAQGWGAWPTCSAKAGASGSAPAAAPQAPAQRHVHKPVQRTQRAQPAQPAQQPVEPRTFTRADRGQSRGDYTVRSGDTLGSIAAAHGTSVSAVFAANRAVIGGNPDLILPGQQLNL